MFNSLINGKDGEISRAGKAANDEERLEGAEGQDRTIGKSVGPVNVIGTGKVERFFWNRFAFVFEQRLCIAPKKFNDVRHTAIILSKRSLSEQRDVVEGRAYEFVIISIYQTLPFRAISKRQPAD